jgi:hypothetical protein
VGGRDDIRRRGRASLALLCLAFAGCTRVLVWGPDFATRPFAPFSRDAAVAIAVREWRTFGERYDDRRECASSARAAKTDDTPERQDGLWQRVGEYRWLGLPPGHPHRAWTGKHDARGVEYPPDQDGTYAWSAAFVSYVMRMAGAGDRFVYDDVHATYINQAARAALGREPIRAAVAMRPERYVPEVGDLICAGRGEAAHLRFDDLPAPPFPSHCGLVIAREAGALDVIGGNVADAVTMTRIPTTANGLLVAPDGSSVDRCAYWFVVLAIRYDA